MTPAAIHHVMDTNHLNVKRLAALLFVHDRTVYQWLEGRNSIPRVTWEYLLLITEPMARVVRSADGNWRVQ